MGEPFAALLCAVRHDFKRKCLCVSRFRLPIVIHGFLYASIIICANVSLNEKFDRAVKVHRTGLRPIVPYGEGVPASRRYRSD